MDLLSGGTATPLTRHYTGNAVSYADSNESEDGSSPANAYNYYLINEQRWRSDAVLPVSLLPAAEGMSARSQLR